MFKTKNKDDYEFTRPEFFVDVGEEEVEFTAVANFYGRDYPGNYYDPPESRDIEMGFLDKDGEYLSVAEVQHKYNITDSRLEELEQEFFQMDADKRYDGYDDHDDPADYGDKDYDLADW